MCANFVLQINAVAGVLGLVYAGLERLLDRSAEGDSN